MQDSSLWKSRKSSEKLRFSILTSVLYKNYKNNFFLSIFENITFCLKYKFKLKFYKKMHLDRDKKEIMDTEAMRKMQ